MLIDQNSQMKRLCAKGFETVEDVATFFPRKYYDFRKVKHVADLAYGEYTTVYGKILRLSSGPKANTLVIVDDAGDSMAITWFNTDYMFRRFAAGQYAYFAGKVSVFNNSWTIVNPILCDSDASKVLRILPVYRKFSGISDNFLKSQIAEAVSIMKLDRSAIEKDLFAKSLGLPEYFAAVEEMHNPTDGNAFRAARMRIDYDKIFDFYKDLKEQEKYRVASSVGPLQKTAETQAFIQNSLPFRLTPGQETTVSTIISEAQAGNRIHSIVSGDVGCGKTVVALISAILMTENGFQTAIAAPTLVLAKQHYEEFTKMTRGVTINGHPVRIALFTGETKKRERKNICSLLESGQIDILIGTHAIISDEIAYQALGMTIIDEEHKFGVAQKARLEEYDKVGAHHISMTATPIPRSIAMTIYGRDLAVLPIETMPNGRKPIITKQCLKVSAAFDAIAAEIAKGHQAYIICPFIEQSSDSKFKDVVSLDQAEELLDDYVRAHPGFAPRTLTISGDMKQADVLARVAEFAEGKADILISTTIVEVGVNVPNSTAICIMSANRFGLAALHQLRGRVGRGRDQSYCLLCANASDEKLDVLCSTTNGFVIAEKDLELRGPGDLSGTDQTGSSDIINLIISRPAMTKKVKAFFFGEK